jgi:hypothetical protein
MLLSRVRSRIYSATSHNFAGTPTNSRVPNNVGLVVYFSEAISSSHGFDFSLWASWVAVETRDFTVAELPWTAAGIGFHYAWSRGAKFMLQIGCYAGFYIPIFIFGLGKGRIRSVSLLRSN